MTRSRPNQAFYRLHLGPAHHFRQFWVLNVLGHHFIGLWKKERPLILSHRKKLLKTRPAPKTPQILVLATRWFSWYFQIVCSYSPSKVRALTKSAVLKTPQIGPPVLLTPLGCTFVVLYSDSPDCPAFRGIFDNQLFWIKSLSMLKSAVSMLGQSCQWCST